MEQNNHATVYDQLQALYHNDDVYEEPKEIKSQKRSSCKLDQQSYLLKNQDQRRNATLHDQSIVKENIHVKQAQHSQTNYGTQYSVKNKNLMNHNRERHYIQRQNSYITQSKIQQIQQRLKNLHYFYNLRINQQRQKNLQRNQTFMNILEQMQKTHTKRISQYQQKLSQIQHEKQDIGYVDDRMVGLRQTINQILKQSSQLKLSNEQIFNQIQSKQKIVKRKQQQASKLKKQLDDYRNQLQQWQRIKLKENKKNRQLLELINTTVQ